MKGFDNETAHSIISKIRQFRRGILHSRKGGGDYTVEQYEVITVGIYGRQRTT